MAAAIQIAMGDSFEKQLCNLPLFRGLTDDKAALLATLFHYVPILTNEILFEEVNRLSCGSAVVHSRWDGVL